MRQNLFYPNILAYSNRLSDFLFTLARFANKAQGVPDTVWKKDFVPAFTPSPQMKLETKQENHNHLPAETKGNLPVKVSTMNGKN